MKKILLILSAFIIMLVSCTQKNNVEIIPDYDAIYFPVSEVDTPVEILGDTDKQLDEVLKIISESSKPNTIGYYFFESQMFINEVGKLEKIGFKKILPSKFEKEGELNYNTEILFKKLTKYLETLEFSTALKDGKSVKSQYKWEGSFRVDSSGQSEVYLGGLQMSGLKMLSNFNSKDFEEIVDEMPAPVGGIKTIAENVIYPKKAKNNGIQGRVFVKAFIDEEGDVVWTKIIKGIGGGCELAAINAVQETKFIPGVKDGKTVKVQVTIPIMFKLN